MNLRSAAPFAPAWWCPGAHAQTLWASLLRPVLEVPLRRERWDTSDGDFLCVDRMDGPPGSPCLLALHGLEGSSDSKPVRGILHSSRRAGWRAAALNFRSCGGEPNRLRRSYHGGETSDLAWVVERVVKESPDAPLFCVGFSLGGNVLLKYLGERGAALPEQLRAAAAISTPFSLAASVRRLERGFSRIYRRQLVANLRRKTLAKLDLFPDIISRDALRAVCTLEQFDNAITAPVHGYPDAESYWAACSSLRFLPGVRRPTLLINAQDDPFFPGQLLPREEVAANPSLSALFPTHGGHMGFLSGAVPGLPSCWAEAQVIAFFKQQMAGRSQPVTSPK